MNSFMLDFQSSRYDKLTKAEAVSELEKKLVKETRKHGMMELHAN